MFKSKINLRVIFSLAVLMSMPAMAENRAVEISINGIGPAVDAAAFETVKQVIGHAVASGVVDKFIVSGYGIEGGFAACAQASFRTKAFGAFVKQLRTITPDPNTTAYTLRSTAACPEETTVCTQEVKQCPDGSFVGRVPPSCNFAPCPGE